MPSQLKERLRRALEPAARQCFARLLRYWPSLQSEQALPTDSRIEIFPNWESLPEDQRKLLEVALEARKRSYSVYSKFAVGVAIRMDDETIITGSNQENANYKASCAENVGLNTASHEGYRGRVKAIAVVGAAHDTENPHPVCPCGQCRQDIKEHQDNAGEDILLLLSGNTRGKVVRALGIDALLPLSFGPKDLGIEVRYL